MSDYISVLVLASALGCSSDRASVKLLAVEWVLRSALGLPLGPESVLVLVHQGYLDAHCRNRSCRRLH